MIDHLDDRDLDALTEMLVKALALDTSRGEVQTIYRICARFNPRGRLQPVKMRYGEVANLLREMASAIDAGESYEGNAEYLIPDLMNDTLTEDDWVALPEDERGLWEATDESTMRYRPRNDVCEVRGVYRVGNDMGQGGVVMIGTLGPPLHEGSV